MITNKDFHETKIFLGPKNPKYQVSSLTNKVRELMNSKANVNSQANRKT